MKILNSAGQPILLNDMEKRIVDVNQKLVNALGYEIDITSLTTISKSIVEQKFYEIPFADYFPVRVGEGAWSTNLVTYLSYALGDDFATGIQNTNSQGGRMAMGDAGVQSISIPVNNWAKEIVWTLFDLQQASKSGNWDIVTAKEKSRKRNWDLGLQKIAFLGLGTNPGVRGLLNQAGITMNTTLITQSISSMTGAQLKAFCAGVLDAYRVNCARTAMPSVFVMPESDYLGIAAPSSADFPLKSVKQVLEETFATMTGKKDFKILPCAYADNAQSGFGWQQYALLNYDEDSLRMDIPVDYSNTLANSINNFSFQNVGYGQFTGVLAYRPSELLYFKY